MVKRILLIGLIVCLSCSAWAWTLTSTFESFNAGSSPYGSDGFGYWAGSNVVTSTTRAHSGTKSAAFNWAQGSEGWNNELGQWTQTAAYGSTVWYRAYVYFPVGWNWGSAGHIKIMRLTVGGGHMSIITYSDGDGNAHFFMNNEPYGCNGDYDGGDCGGIALPFSIDYGQWTCLEIAVTISTTAPMVRCWKNGNLVIQDIVHPTTQGSTGMSETILMGTWNALCPVNQTCYWDDIVITNETPAARDASGNPMIGPTDWEGEEDTTDPYVTRKIGGNPPR